MFFSILIFLIILSILVFVHEFGHFVMAKRSGVWVEEFGFGLPPKVWGKKVGDTIYSINALPFGGFVRLHGESTDEKLKYPKKAFINKDKKTRVKIIIAGVVMHFLLAITSFAIVYSATGIQKETKDVRVLEVAAGSPSQTAGLLVGDIVRDVDGTKIETSDSFINFVGEKKGKKIKVTIERKMGDKFETKKLTMTPRENPPNSEGPLGVAISNIEVYFPPLALRPFVGIYYGFKDAFTYGSTILVSLVRVFRELFSGRIPEDITGPVGIFILSSEVAKYGIISIINFVGILAVNLAILNILPFPALDGGRLIFIAIEGIIGKKILPKVEAAFHAVGMVLLLILLLLITARDIQRLIQAGSLSRFVDSVLK